MKENNSLTVDKFLNFSKDEVLNIVKSDYPDLAEEFNIDGVFIVWNSRILGNMKCIVSTMYNDKYYEFTYNVSKNEIYIDVYNKEKNYAVNFNN